MSERPILYSFRRCPFAMRARMALDAAGIDLEHREILLRDKPQAMLDASPKGTVPVLVLPNGTVLEESLDIMEYALGRQDPQGWLDGAESDRSDAEAFLDVFKPALDRYKYASRYDPSVKRGAVEHSQRTIAMDALLRLAEPLERSRFLRSDKPRLIDIATFPFVRQFAAVEPDWWTETAPLPLKTWLHHFLTSERFARIMKKRPLWQDPSQGLGHTG